MNITQFKIGEAIVRTERAKEKTIGDIMDMSTQTVRDGSFIGERMIFKGMANGVIYVEHADESEPIFFGKTTKLRPDDWSEGWEVWIDPTALTNDTSKISKQELKRLMKQAEQKEDFEAAGRYKKLLSKLK